MRYAIKQISADRELWLVRAAHKGVWGKGERAFGFFRKPTAERWVAKLTVLNPGVSLEIVEVMSRVDVTERENAASSEVDSGENEADIEVLPEPQAA
jgi:hypothetical protein